MELPAPTARLAVVAALAALAAAAVPGTVVTRVLVVDALLALLAFADWLLAPGASRVVVERSLPPAATVGAEVPVDWRVRSSWSRSTRVAVADQLAPSLGAGTRRFRGRVPPGGELRATTTITPRRRGRFEPTELAVRAEGPLGLLARQWTQRTAHPLRVFPRFRSRDEAELRIDRARMLEVGLRSARGRGGGTEFESLREYTVDDESRRIDWAATARAGRPIVRTYRAERNQPVLVLFDNGRVMAGRVDGVPRTEPAMDAAMLLTSVATRLGDRCGLVAFDRAVRATVEPGHGKGQLGRVTEALYALEPVLTDSDYRAVFAHTVARFRRRSLIVVLTDLVEHSIGDVLLPALPVLLRHHLVIVGAVQDPQVRAWADRPAVTVEAVHRQAAAVGTLQARERAAARLRAAGAVVVDASPARLAAELGDAYLAVKATGRL